MSNVGNMGKIEKFITKNKRGRASMFVDLKNPAPPFLNSRIATSFQN
jgi:hypothetical protein